MNLLLSILLSLSLSDQAKAVINKPNIQDERVYRLEQKIADAYDQCGDDCVDSLIDGLPTDWYKGLDLYIAPTEQEAIHVMATDTEASYRNAKAVSVSAENLGEYSIIVIVSL